MGRTPNDDRSDSMKPTNDAYRDSLDKHSTQLHPEHNNHHGDDDQVAHGKLGYDGIAGPKSSRYRLRTMARASGHSGGTPSVAQITDSIRNERNRALRYRRISRSASTASPSLLSSAEAVEVLPKLSHFPW